MSESILKALMQLFAIIATANKEGVNEKSRSIVESYLRLMLSSEQVTEYLQLFDKYVEERGGGVKKDGTQERKRTSLNSVKVLRICEQINGELKQDQKLLVLLQLLEFISFGEEITEQEIDFVKTVSDIFNIPEDEYFNCYAFTLNPKLDEIPHKENILILDKNNESPNAEVKHLRFKDLEGHVMILFLPSINAYAFRYVGETELYLNGHSIMLNRTYVGKNIIPMLLNDGKKLFAYRFSGYWKDVGTISSLWETNMDILDKPEEINLVDRSWKIFSRNPVKPSHFIGSEARVTNSALTDGCRIYGDVNHSVLSESVVVEKGAVVKDCVLLPGVVVKEGAHIERCIVDFGTIIGKDVKAGPKVEGEGPYTNHKICSEGICVFERGLKIKDGAVIPANSMIDSDVEVSDDESVIESTFRV